MKLSEGGSLTFTPIKIFMQLWTYVQNQYKGVDYESVTCLNQEALGNVSDYVRDLTILGINSPVVIKFTDALNCCIIT